MDSTIPSARINSVRIPGAQWQGQGTFFTDANLTTMYNFAGFGDKDTQQLNSVETFNTLSQKWGNASVSGGAFNSLGRGFSASANTATSGLGLGFITGGLDAAPEPQGMIRFDASEPGLLQWRNETQEVPHTVGATMQYARFGKSGVLIVAGGYVDVSLLESAWCVQF